VGTVGQIPLGELALHSLGRINFNPLTLDFLHRTATFTPGRAECPQGFFSTARRECPGTGIGPFQDKTYLTFGMWDGIVRNPAFRMLIIVLFLFRFWWQKPDSDYRRNPDNLRWQEANGSCDKWH